MTTKIAPLDQVAKILEQYTPEQLRDVMEGLDPADLAIIERVLADKTRSGWRSSPAAMGQQFGDLETMAHTRYLSDKFVDAVQGRSTRQIWNVPPQHGKSRIASRWGPVWAFDQDPTTLIALTSYGYALARENAVFVRDTLVEHGDVLTTRLRRDARRADRFMTDQAGGLIAAGVGGPLTGFGARGIVIDDPFKNWQEAHSEARRLLVWNWYRSTVRSRLHDRPGRPGWIILVMTRWHEDDLTGRFLDADAAGDGEGWELVRLPALAEENDALGRRPGEALAPLLYDERALISRARALGSYLTAGLEQQRPAPEEGTDIMRAWWRWFDAAPPRFDDSLTSWDMKLKDKEGGDFVVGQAWGRTGSDFWCVDQLRGQWNFATVKTAIVLMHVRHPRIRRHIVENTGNGPEVMAELRRAQADYEVGEDIRSMLGITDEEVPKVNAVFRRGMTGLIAENPKGDKRARMRAYTPLIEAGNVHLPLRTSWADGLVDEAATFPNGSHDDQVDTVSQALKRLSSGTGTASAPKGKISTPKPSVRSARPSGTAIATPRGVRRGPNSRIRKR